jgi:alanine-glyoxylate transaminase/serine-glyoxylate transaminase/serine-pyruvate transaminase
MLPARINPSRRRLMGPGPSDVAPSVLEVMALPTLGHLDPQFLAIMDEIRDMLRALFGTRNALTFPISGTGSAGMETCFANLLEPGDRALIGVNGVFGGRMVDVASRCGAEVVTVEIPWGETISPDAFIEAAEGRSFNVMALVHAETSTGALQDLTGMRAVADQLGALLLVDAVTSLGGHAVETDGWGIDAIYSGTQKCLSCPPGLAPISFSARATERLARRQTPVQSWYLDLSMIGKYWGAERAYHHTAPINMLYGLHEAARLALEEGLDVRIARHAANASTFRDGVQAMGLNLPVAPSVRLNPLTVIQIPEGIDDGAVRRHLLDESGIEIGGGLGAFKGKVWRVGLMGAASTPANVSACLDGLREALAAQSYAGAT